jgi:hypothetical protein
MMAFQQLLKTSVPQVLHADLFVLGKDAANGANFIVAEVHRFH